MKALDEYILMVVYVLLLWKVHFLASFFCFAQSTIEEAGLFLVFFLGSLVPFSLRILLAELPQFMGRTNDALDRLFELQRTCRQVLENLQNDLNEDATEADMIPEDRKGAGNIVF